jgi:hypothetical protein
MCTVRFLGSLSSSNKPDRGSSASLFFLLVLAMVFGRDAGISVWGLVSGVCCSMDLVIPLLAATVLWGSLCYDYWSLSEEAAHVRSRGETCTSSWCSSVSIKCMVEVTS